MEKEKVIRNRIATLKTLLIGARPRPKTIIWSFIQEEKMKLKEISKEGEKDGKREN